jgi:maltoporin
MKNFVKFTLLAIVAASASVASAADLEFHGYARVGMGISTSGGNQVSFTQSVSGKGKFRLGNEADWCLEPGFTMSFTKLDDKSAWGVHMLPAVYRRMNGDNANNQAADGNLNVSYKEFYFYGQNVPQLGGGEIWAGRRYFGRNYLGAITDSFLEAQDGVGFGVYDIPVGPAKLGFDVATPSVFNDGADANVIDTNLSIGGRVTNIPTFNKDSNLQIWARVYLPWQKTNGDAPVVADAAKRNVGFSSSIMHVAGLGTAGNITGAFRFDQNAYTDQQDNGAGGKRNLEFDVVYGVNVPSIRTGVDAIVAWRQTKSVKQYKDQADPVDDTMNLFLAGFRTDTQISGPFRFLLEFGYDTNKTKGAGQKQHNLWKVTPCFAISGGNDPWSRPTFRFFATIAGWNKDGTADVTGAWKDSGLAATFAGKTSGSVLGVQAEGWW